MQVKLGCLTRAYTDFSFDRALEGVAKAGFHYVGFMGVHNGKRPFNADTSERDAKEMADKARTLGLEVVAGYVGGLWHGANGWRRFIKLGAAMDLDYLICITPLPPRGKGVSRQELGAAFVKTAMQVLPDLEDAGIRLEVKPDGGPFGDAEGLVELASTINHPLFGVCYDPGNVFTHKDLVPEEDLPTCAAQVRSLIIKDRQVDNRRLFANPGEGVIDWPKIFAILSKHNWNGHGTGHALVEMLNAPTAAEMDRIAAETLQRLVGWVGAAGLDVLV